MCSSHLPAAGKRVTYQILGGFLIGSPALPDQIVSKGFALRSSTRSTERAFLLSGKHRAM